MSNNMEQSRYRFFSDFDSGNLGKAEEVAVDENDFHDKEFLLWLNPDCSGKQFQAGNTGTWFFFGMTGGQPGALLMFRIMNLGRQVTLFNQGMRPVCLITSEVSGWKR